MKIYDLTNSRNYKTVRVKTNCEFCLSQLLLGIPNQIGKIRAKDVTDLIFPVENFERNIITVHCNCNAREKIEKFMQPKRKRSIKIKVKKIAKAKFVPCFSEEEFKIKKKEKEHEKLSS